jgi:hypothetical protein
MPPRTKRSISLPSALAKDIDRAAARDKTSFSGWIAQTAAHRLRLEAGRRALAAWEREHGSLSTEELADGRARARALLGGAPARRARRSA